MVLGACSRTEFATLVRVGVEKFAIRDAVVAPLS
ncbi:hypothetical protein BH18ACI5_BH18ACI5_23650 [soil metagenome]